MTNIHVCCKNRDFWDIAPILFPIYFYELETKINTIKICSIEKYSKYRESSIWPSEKYSEKKFLLKENSLNRIRLIHF